MLRGFAAISVALYHFTFQFEKSVGPHKDKIFYHMNNGQLGVNLFFIISGFVIIMTLENVGNIRQFSVSRFARIYPAYIAAMSITILANFISGENLVPQGPENLLLNFTMLSAVLKYEPIDGSYWTLSYELTFYILISVAYYKFKFGKIEYVCLIWMSFLPILIFFNLFTEENHKNILAVSMSCEWSYLFVIGMMIWKIASRRQTGLTYATLALAVLASPFAAHYGGVHEFSDVKIMIVTIIFAIAVYLFGKNEFKSVIWRPLVFLGNISYSLYLVHQVVGYVVIKNLEASGIGSNLAILCTLALVVLIASALRHAVELPMQRLILSAYRTKFA
jgi:peptidoglycan/LPS O-acetylase OafA/YrhL